MKNLSKLLITIVLPLFLNCSDDDGTDGSGIADVDLAGTVFDTPFEAEGGIAYETEDGFFIHIANVEADCDSDTDDFSYSIYTTVPSIELGNYKDVNVSFSKIDAVSVNDPSASVSLVSRSFTSNPELGVKVKANANAENTVEGFIRIPICIEE